MHVDCDAFYAAVEELDRPELKDVPFAVGKGVLTTCNYHARKYGCRSAMAGFVAKKLCPQLIFLPLNFEKYTAKAKEVRAVLAEYDSRFESASLDEAYLNITQYCEDNGIAPLDAVTKLRTEVHKRTHITVSAGLAANAKLAKIGSNKNKPNGQFALPNDRTAVMDFMRDMPTRKVNGIGRVFERELDAIGVRTCGDIFGQRQYLTRLFGEKAFQFLVQTYLGLGRTRIQPAEDYERKSVGTESTFRDMQGPEELRQKLRSTAEELEGDLRRTQFKGRTLVLKIKLHTYELLTRQTAPPRAVSTADELYRYSLPMLVKLEKEMPGMKLRLMGLRCTHLVSSQKSGIDFFGHQRLAAARRESPALALDHDDASEWEAWPEAEFEEAARLEKADEMNELERLSQEAPTDENFVPRHSRVILPNPKRDEPAAEKPAVWDCPVCGFPQEANDQTFNAHIDACLSRGTIKEAVEATADAVPSTDVSTVGKPQSRGRDLKGSGSKRKPEPGLSHFWGIPKRPKSTS